MTTLPFARPRSVDEPLHRIDVGRVEIYPLVQLHYRPDPPRFFPDIATWAIDPDAWYWQEPYIDEGALAIDMGGFLVRTADRVVLIDAGIGNGKNRPNPVFQERADDWLTLLSRIGVSVDDVDTVLFTHLHVDHVGFATTLRDGRWEPTFPNAVYRVTTAELEYWTSGDAAADVARLGGYIDDSILPLRDAGLLELTTPDFGVSEQIRLVPAPGHTPGNVCVEIVSEGRRAVFAGDMIHHPLQLAFPQYSTDYCVDDAGATVARQALLAGLGPDDLLFPAHFPNCLPGRVTPDGSGGYMFHRESGVIL